MTGRIGRVMANMTNGCESSRRSVQKKGHIAGWVGWKLIGPIDMNHIVGLYEKKGYIAGLVGWVPK